MTISIITVFPELHKQFLQTSLLARAEKNNLVQYNLVKLSDFCEPKERIDESVCGPGTGMIIKPEILDKAIEACEKKHGKGFKIFFSPQGKQLTQTLLKQFANLYIEKNKNGDFLPHFIDKKENNGSYSTTHNDDFSNLYHLILICSRYEGIDARVEAFYADAILSIGDYVLMGGDLPAQVFLEGFLRLIPNVVGKEKSVQDESFSQDLLDYPEYGLPKKWNDLSVPQIILSGNHEKIAAWRHEKACKKTLLERFDWFRKSNSSHITTCKKYIPNHYVALMHTDIVIKGGRVGCSSVTSLDLHDIARSGATYGITNTFMVSPLKDQQNIMKELLGFWQSEKGKEYNFSRHQATSRVIPIETLQDVIQNIEAKEGKKPLMITTSAKQHDHIQTIDYFDQGLVWKEDKPILLVFGTGQGLCQDVIDASNYLLLPVGGMTDYRHLSVRSAVAIILDRWLGIQQKNSQLRNIQKKS